MLGRRQLVTISLLTFVVFSAPLLIAAPPVHVQTRTVLYYFMGSPDGADPTSRLVFDDAGNLYGTTGYGGVWGRGTIFELSPNGSGGWNVKSGRAVTKKTWSHWQLAGPWDPERFQTRPCRPLAGLCSPPW